VLGAEYARAPVRDAPPARRLSLAFAPAVALSVFVALVFVDVAGDPSGSSNDESGSALTAATSREADDASAGAGSAGSVGAPPSAANSTFEADATTDKAAEEQAEAPAGTPAAAAGAAQVEPALRSSGPEATPANGEAAIMAADAAPSQEPAPEPLTIDAPDDDGSDGVSTLRVLQVTAVAVFLASGFYVFVWPRISRGGSE
jgi:hypothetical protein